MLRIVAWIAAGCLVLILVMALLRGRGSEPERAPIAPPAGTAAAAPAVIAPTPPEPKVEAPKTAPITPPDIDQQVRDDAAAVGMTTAPEPDSAQPEEPPT